MIIYKKKEFDVSMSKYSLYCDSFQCTLHHTPFFIFFVITYLNLKIEQYRMSEQNSSNDNSNKRTLVMLAANNNNNACNSKY